MKNLLPFAAIALLIVSRNAQAKVYETMKIINPTRGERNNNPGNIRFNSAWTWQGQTGQDSGGYLIFDTVENGIRAIAKDLKSKYWRGLNTVRKIISVYAPPNENNTGAYISAVCSGLDVSPDTILNLNDLYQLTEFVKQIIKHENGRISYAGSTIIVGVERA